MKRILTLVMTLMAVSILSTLSISAHAVSAQGALVVEDLLVPGDGLITLDTRTGLQWLDVTATQGLSYNQAEASVYATTYGFRHATYAEVRALKESEGLVLASRYYPDTGGRAQRLINLMGGFTRYMGWFNEFTGWTDMGHPTHTSASKLTIVGSSYKWDYYGWTSRDWPWSGAGNFLVRANQPPDTSGAYADKDCLWPPNHKFVNVNILGVTDPDGDPVTITIDSITSDEPTASDKGSGGKKHSPDASGVGTDTASVRAERSGKGDGRVYQINFTANDGNGGIALGSVEVSVPHDKSLKDCLAIDSGQDYDATQIN